jgi:hypothetical protein
LAYQPPASDIFLSEQTSHQQPASSTFLSEQTSTSHQPNEQTVKKWFFSERISCNIDTLLQIKMMCAVRLCLPQ